MRILTAIPCLYDGQTCLKAFRSVVSESDILILNNGGDDSVKQAIALFKSELHPHAVLVFENEKNCYVTGAWNSFIKYFIENDFYDQLVIMNSDLILEAGWSKYIVDGISCLTSHGEAKEDYEAYEGTQGIFVHMNRDMAKMVYPIPDEIKLWFSDDWIYTILRETGIKTVIKHQLISLHWHGGSQTIAKLPNKSEMIEDDKISWKEIVEPIMKERIANLKLIRQHEERFGKLEPGDII